MSISPYELVLFISQYTSPGISINKIRSLIFKIFFSKTTPKRQEKKIMNLLRIIQTNRKMSLTNKMRIVCILHKSINECIQMLFDTSCFSIWLECRTWQYNTHTQKKTDKQRGRDACKHTLEHLPPVYRTMAGMQEQGGKCYSLEKPSQVSAWCTQTCRGFSHPAFSIDGDWQALTSRFFVVSSARGVSALHISEITCQGCNCSTVLLTNGLIYHQKHYTLW